MMFSIAIRVANFLAVCALAVQRSVLPPTTQLETSADFVTLSARYDRIIVPSAKIAFCAFPRVGSTSFHMMFNDMNGINPNAGRVSTTQKFHKHWRHVNKREGWTFGVFVRDPLERYHSAFGHKCILTEHHDDTKECHGETVDVRDGWDEEKVISVFEARVIEQNKTGIPSYNVHWKPMSQLLESCDGKKFAPEQVDVLGHLNATTSEQILTLLDMASSNTSSQNRELVTKYFGDAHDSNLGISEAPTHGLMEKYYRKPEIAQAVYQFYKEDYDFFGLEKPSVLQQV